MRVATPEYHDLLDQLKDLQDLMASTIETIREALVMLDGKLQVIQVNKTFLDTFQVKRHETLGKSFFELDDGQWNVPHLRQLLDKVLPENNSFENFEVEHFFPRIGKRTMLLNARQVTLRGKPKRRILLAIEDITERKEEVHRKDAFISMTAHELKTPLTSIKAYNQLLRHMLRANRDEKLVEYSEKMQLQIDKLQQLIFDLLEVSHIQAGKLEFNYSLFSLDDLVTEVIESLQLVYPSHTISVKGKTTKPLFADRDRVSQVITNLVSNAIKYSPGASEVEVHIKETKNETIVTVKDYGVGIEEKHLPRIFDRFYRVNDANDKKYSGIGIGLYVASEIVKGHRGMLEVASKVGKGSTFSFRLPLKQQSQP